MHFSPQSLAAHRCDRQMPAHVAVTSQPMLSPSVTHVTRCAVAGSELPSFVPTLHPPQCTAPTLLPALTTPVGVDLRHEHTLPAGLPHKSERHHARGHSGKSQSQGTSEYPHQNTRPAPLHDTAAARPPSAGSLNIGPALSPRRLTSGAVLALRRSTSPRTLSPRINRRRKHGCNRRHRLSRHCRTWEISYKIVLHLLWPVSSYHEWWPPLTMMLRHTSQSGTRRQITDTYSLPVQNVLASLVSHVTTPRSSSGRPIRPMGFRLAHLSSKCGSLSRYAAVILQSLCQSQSRNDS